MKKLLKALTLVAALAFPVHAADISGQCGADQVSILCSGLTGGGVSSQVAIFQSASVLQSSPTLTYDGTTLAANPAGNVTVGASSMSASSSYFNGVFGVNDIDPVHATFTIQSDKQYALEVNNSNSNGHGIAAGSPMDAVTGVTSGAHAGVKAVARGNGGMGVYALLDQTVQNAIGVCVDSEDAGASTANLLEITQTGVSSALSGDAIYVDMAENGVGTFTGNLMDLQVHEVTKFRVDGNGVTTIADGSQGAGKVFTSDASGVGSWQDLGRERVVNACGAGVTACTATCTAGKKALGGGCQTAGVNLDDTFPATDASWECDTLLATTISAYVICAKIP